MNEPAPAIGKDDPGPPPVFISYATADRAEALKVCKAIERRGTRCWISMRDVRPGEKFDQVFAATLVTTGLAGTPTASAPSTSTKLTLEQRLSQLRELREKGLIDEETFREQEKGILSEI